jgi:MSHA biogenesis protein MshJ
MKALDPFAGRLAALAGRLDALTLRERGLIFCAGATLVYIAWQTLLMGPLTVRERNAEQRLIEARRHLADIERLGSTVAADPLIAVAATNRALRTRLAALDSDLHSAAQGYVAPDQMTDMLHQILDEQHGLKLVTLTNLPVVSLSQPAPSASTVAASPTAARASASAGSHDMGPFLHPVELVVEGDYASLVRYLRALESLPWRVHWERLELKTEEYPVSRVRIVIGALSLSQDWISI